MQQRTALIGTALAGILVAGVAVEAAHGAPADKPMAHTVTGQQVTGHKVTGQLVTGQQVSGHKVTDQLVSGHKVTDQVVTGQQAAGHKVTGHKVTGQQVAGQHDAKATRHTTGKAASKSHAVLSGSTTASYFWDDGSGVNGDTGAPAGGKPMQKGLFASPSWPMHTKVKVTYKGRSVTGFVGDRGPGEPSHRGVMLDLDTYTFRHLVDGKKPNSKYDTGTSAGHLKGVKYEVLSWGHGMGKKGAPKPLG
ncbi:septal ring lytic transglycosylase RlpA family protein [Actinomadura citrea]|uniref:Lipoprotein n=1 Tax=Actinomadura citrea TaxID=46158 RepID=A0A7Y9GDY5_9ACTN|nr:septal ring lytic transglycosylase RlpA family protein [Actinomadura citrea]NYE14772.1 hypothetical protein [Actinomadura citrea]GGT82986.1 hypothetical protein GCM10010177_47610 [Actinomadura citrea]